MMSDRRPLPFWLPFLPLPFDLPWPFFGHSTSPRQCPSLPHAKQRVLALRLASTAGFGVAPLPFLPSELDALEDAAVPLGKKPRAFAMPFMCCLASRMLM